MNRVGSRKKRRKQKQGNGEEWVIKMGNKTRLKRRGKEEEKMKD